MLAARLLALPALLAVAFALAACSGSADTDRLSADAFLEQRTPDAVVLDVRTPEEYAAGHLVGAPNINVLADDFRAQVDTLDRNQTVYLYCRTGNRSGRATEIMKEMGFTEVYNVGGFSDLAAAGAETTQ